MNLLGNQWTLETLKKWFTEGKEPHGITLSFDKMSSHLTTSVYSAFTTPPTAERETTNKTPDTQEKEPNDSSIVGFNVKRVE